MTTHFQNAKRYFVTAKTTGPVGLLLAEALGDKVSPDVVLAAGGVWLDRLRIGDAGFEIQAGQTIRVYFSPFQSKRFYLKSEQLIFEDDQVLIIHKPAAVTSVADRSDLHYNVTSGVHAYLRSQGNKTNYAPLTRLDFMVSGLMLFAKTPMAIRQLTRQIQNREIMKLYEATLLPYPDLPRCLRVKNKLDFMGKAFESESGREAHSLFRFKEIRGENPVYSVHLLTGRRHQIRVHAAQYLSPIVGDDLYGPGPGGTLGLRSVGLNFRLLGIRYRVRLQ